MTGNTQNGPVPGAFISRMTLAEHCAASSWRASLHATAARSMAAGSFQFTRSAR